MSNSKNRPPRQGVDRRPRRQENNSSMQENNLERPSVKRRKKKKNNVIPVIIVGILGVVIIALVIMGLKAVFSGEKPQQGSESSSILDVSVTPKPTPIPPPTPKPTPEPAQEPSIEGLKVTEYDEMVIVGDRAYDYYKFDKEKADGFAKAVNNSAAKIGADVKIYSMIIPGATEVMLPITFLNEKVDKTADQAKAIKYVNSQLDTRIKNIEIFPTLKANCDKNLYFKSDNHWTSLAAYYAYDLWAQEKGITVPAIDQYEKITVDGFLGNHYGYTAHTDLSSPETIEVYKPAAALTMGEGESVFADVSESGSGSKYNVFLGGSKDLIKITNPSKDDGSSCVVVVDSNGTVIAPYFAENYQYTYVIDYRKYTNGITAVLEESKATEVIYCFSMAATNAEALIQGINGL